MRPRVFTLRNVLLLLIALLIFGGLAYWLSIGAPLPFGGVPSTAGKLVFVSDRDGHRHLWMTNAADGTGSVAITTGGSDDQQPAWNPSGSELAFVSQGRNGVTPQVYMMDARPGGTAIPLNNTSATKEQPKYGPEGRVFYLASGKVISTNPVNQDTDQVFPDADATRTVAPLLSTGGIASAEISPDGKLLAMALRMEQGQALLLYDVGAQVCEVIGAAADRVLFHFLPDGRLLAVFEDGCVLPKAIPLFGPDQVKANIPAVGPLLLSSVTDTQITLQLGEGDDPNLNPRIPLQKLRLTAIFDTNGTPQQQTMQVIPFKPNSFAVAPDGSQAILAVDTPSTVPQGTLPPGLWVFPLTGGQGGPPLFDQPAHDPTFAPDGAHVAFASGKDIFMVPTDRSTPATNLTKGQGANVQPAWSPAQPKK